MTNAPFARPAQADQQSFQQLTEPYRRELQLHCYRILGSMQDAEDMLQETLLAAWRGLGGFERRASLRNWLYKIATNRCLNALRDAGRRPVPARQFAFPVPRPSRLTEPIWLEPYPDLLLEGIIDATPGPAARYETKETVELAFIEALQHLPPRQRAVLVLRDVIGYHASEVASMLDTTEESVKGALKRARAAVGQRHTARNRPAPPANSPQERELARRFAEAFEGNDVEGVVKLLTDRAWLTMPPATVEYQGREAIRAFFRAGWERPGAGRFRLVATRANMQPAFGCYRRDPHAGIAHGAGMIAISLDGDLISFITRFEERSVMSGFGLPTSLPD
ncbi:MAG: sigma-70 family RNA polymerase sigma factor [Solirubrobacterales bacterium]|nr:sigma-70 family RNA polymerase sigma factor [Solirubrobacterales bacterium]